jgi:hypothetical protein
MDQRKTDVNCVLETEITTAASISHSEELKELQRDLTVRNYQ